jgi:hypothetical protein
MTLFHHFNPSNWDRVAFQVLFTLFHHPILTYPSHTMEIGWHRQFSNPSIHTIHALTIRLFMNFLRKLPSHSIPLFLNIELNITFLFLSLYSRSSQKSSSGQFAAEFRKFRTDSFPYYWAIADSFSISELTESIDTVFFPMQVFHLLLPVVMNTFNTIFLVEEFIAVKFITKSFN